MVSPTQRPWDWLTANTRAIGRAFKVMPQDGAGIRYCGEPISTYAYVNPAVAVLLGWLLANGRLDDGRAALAVLIILSAVVLVSVKGGEARRPASD